MGPGACGEGVSSTQAYSVMRRLSAPQCNLLVKLTGIAELELYTCQENEDDVTRAIKMLTGHLDRASAHDGKRKI